MIQGMTLRDWFAGQSLSSLTSLIGQDNGNSELVAEYAYLIADCMMDEKKEWDRACREEKND